MFTQSELIYTAVAAAAAAVAPSSLTAAAAAAAAAAAKSFHYFTCGFITPVFNRSRALIRRSTERISRVNAGRAWHVIRSMRSVSTSKKHHD
jgi:hypothetical protein